MTKHYKPLRKAIAMIELIFSIVIMGIVMLSAPMMLTTATKSTLVSFQQESIAIAAAHANTLMTYAWDEKNTESYAGGALQSRILTVSAAGGDPELNVRVGTRRIMDANLSSLSSTFGIADGNGTIAGLFTEVRKDDIDDFNGTSPSLSIANTTSTTAKSYQDDYMDINITLNTDISYLDDDINYNACGTTGNGCTFNRPFNGGDQVLSSNIKRIQVTLTSSNVSDKNILLKSFMCNIGAANPLREDNF